MHDGKADQRLGRRLAVEPGDDRDDLTLKRFGILRPLALRTRLPKRD
jgi:hypothetical protein